MNENGKSKEREIYVRYNIEGHEFEGRGHPEDVNQHVAFYASMVAPKTESGAIQLQMPEVIEADEPQALLENGTADSPEAVQSNGKSAVEEKSETGNKKSHEVDFVTFYRNKAPKNQWQEVLVIAYYYCHYKGLDCLDYDILSEAYMELAILGVKEPSNPRQAVKVADAEKSYLYKPRKENGIFAPTIQGREFVESMPSE
jgi:hypothetical protein